MNYRQVLHVARRTMVQLEISPGQLTCQLLAARLGDYLETEIVLEPSEELHTRDAAGVTARDFARYLVQYDPGGTIRRQHLTIYHELGHVILGHPLGVIDHAGAQVPGASDGPPKLSLDGPSGGPPVAPPSISAGGAAEIDPDLIDPSSVAAVRGSHPAPLFGADVAGGAGRRLWKDSTGQGDAGEELRARIDSVYSNPIEWGAETFGTICWGWSSEQAGHTYMTIDDPLARALSFDGGW